MGDSDSDSDNNKSISILQRLEIINKKISNIPTITVLTFESEGQFNNNNLYPWTMTYGSLSEENFGYIFPLKGKIITWAFNCIGANIDDNSITSSVVFNLLIDNINKGELSLLSNTQYNNISKTGRSTGNITPNIDIDFSDINLQFNRCEGPNFDTSSRYRLSFYIQLSE